MGLKTKKIFLGFIENQFLRWRFTKSQYRGGIVSKRGQLRQFTNLRGCLERKRGFVFFLGGGGLTPMRTTNLGMSI